MLRSGLIPLFFFFVSAFPGSAAEFPETRQIIFVVTDDWSSIEGKLSCFEYSGNRWQSVMENVSVTVGKSGLGVGIGLHGNELTGPKKKEGDGRAPAGIFPLEFGFGAKPLALRNFFYHQSDANDRWVDDAKSRYYNQWVKTNDPNIRKDWKSAESMILSSGLYDYVVVVGHNRRQPVKKGEGSAIFMHAWKRPGSPTVGCTAMKKETVKRILEWLKTSSKPLLVQVPQSEIGKVHLPASIRNHFASE